LEGGAAEWADVLWIGPAEEWEEIKSTYSETRGGIIEVDVLGRRVSILLTTVSEI
jgi:hypothetical protein